MARLIYAMNTSLDGYISDRDGKFEWAASTPELFAAFNELQRPIGTYLHPIIIGGGTPYLPQDVRMPLELVGEHRLGGVVHLHYRANDKVRS